MNLPNKLTMLRVILIPFFVAFLMTQKLGTTGTWIAIGIFAVASITDFFDGKIARKYNLVTNFGKFMDPLADKLLVCSALICFIELKLLPSWFVIIIIAREFVISGFRLIASDNGVVIAASWWGKFKTAFQMILTIFLLLARALGESIFWNGLALVSVPKDLAQTIEFNFWNVGGTLLAWVTLLLTIISLIDYLVKNKSVMKDQK